MNVTNLYRHADGGFYCLLSEDAPMKHPDSGEWLSGVIYTGIDQQMRSTTTQRWNERFSSFPAERIDDEQVWAMIRRCNASEFTYDDVFASWHESETAIQAELLELALCASLVAVGYDDPAGPSIVSEWDGTERKSITMTVKPEHFQHILQNYTITRDPVDGGYTLTITK